MECNWLLRLDRHGYQSQGFSKSPVSLADVRDTAKSGMGYRGNRHLNYLVEFILANVGGLFAEASSPPEKQASVGGSIVLGARESRVQGEGSQGVSSSRVESKPEPEASRTRRKVTRGNRRRVTNSVVTPSAER